MGVSKTRNSGGDGSSREGGEWRRVLVLEVILSLNSDSSSHGD
jgi:hypothetical protein